ncbi:MAG TPA: MAPEG family protein [Sphingomonas sp.]
MLPVSLTFAGAFALINLWLAFRVSATRMRSKVMIGDGDNPGLRARMRAQANFIEYTPFVMILIALIEIVGGARTWLWAIGIVYVLGRIAHAFGMDKQTMPNPLRAGGAIVTWLILLGLAIWAIWLGGTTHVEAVRYL